MQVQVVKRDAFEAVGLMWEGTYEAAGKGEIRELLAVLQRRLAEIGGVADREHIVGISWNEPTPARQTSGDGFRYFVGVRVAGGAGVPEGMTRIIVPAAEYATHENTSRDVFGSYRKLFGWIVEHGRAQDGSSLSLMDEYAVGMDPFGDSPVRLMVPVR